MSLADEMRAAADILEKVSDLYEYLNPEAAEWSAERLRREAVVVES